MVSRCVEQLPIGLSHSMPVQILSALILSNHAHVLHTHIHAHIYVNALHTRMYAGTWANTCAECTHTHTHTHTRRHTHTHTLKPAQWINYNHSLCVCVYGVLIGSDRGCGDVLITPGFLPFLTTPPDAPPNHPVQLDISIFVVWSPVSLWAAC